MTLGRQCGPQRKSPRLVGYDYMAPGAYFVTICIHGRLCLLGDVEDDGFHASDAGRIVHAIWDEIPMRQVGIHLDAFSVMPNHVHGIIVIDRPVGAPFMAPARNRTARTGAINRAPTIGEIVRAYKARTTIAINRRRGTFGAEVWQRNYHDHIIRDDQDLDRVRRYIQENPAQWAFDHENPALVSQGRHSWRPRAIAPRGRAR